jgi:hypothetical protein
VVQYSCPEIELTACKYNCLGGFANCDKALLGKAEEGFLLPQVSSEKLICQTIKTQNFR